MKRFFPILLVFVALACSKNHSSVESEPPLKKVEHSYVMPLDSVRALALKLPSTFSDDPKTKSSGKQIKEILPFSNFSKTPKTRSADPNAPSIDDVYVVNYEDEQGFAIICADKRLPDVFGYSDSGSISDTLSNPGMLMVMELIPNYVARGVNYPPIILDTLPVFDPTVGDGDYTEYFNITGPWTKTGVGPLLTTKWRQDEVFNNFLPCYDHPGELRPVGCVPLAIVQIMAYHKWPESVDVDGIRVMDWSQVRPTNYEYSTTDPILYLFEKVGRVLDIKYDCQSSGDRWYVNDGNGFWKMGYDTKGHYGYDYLHVMTDINNNRPIFAGGYRGRNWTGYKWGGHAWVIDGYKNLTRRVEKYYRSYTLLNGQTINEVIIPQGQSYEYNRWIHCNWGWGGASNGWYLDGIFDVSKIQELDDPKDGQASDRYYSYDIKLLLDIKPKKP